MPAEKPPGNGLERSTTKKVVVNQRLSYWFPKDISWQRRRGVLLAPLLSVLGVAGWLFSQFVALRGWTSANLSLSILVVLALSLVVAAVLIGALLPKWKKRVALFLIVVIIGGCFFLNKVSKRAAIPSLTSTTLVCHYQSELVSRVYARGVALSPGKVPLTPVFQELFYDWTLDLKSDGQTGQVIIVIKEDAPHNDQRIEGLPPDAIVSPFEPGWVSGFQEPERPPDFYSQKIILPGGVNPSLPLALIFRRPLKFSQSRARVGEHEFSRFYTVTAMTATVQKEDQTPRPFSDFVRQLHVLAAQPGPAGKPIPVITNPDTPQPPLHPHEVESSIEIRCGNPNCTLLSPSHLLVMTKPQP